MVIYLFIFVPDTPMSIVLWMLRFQTMQLVLLLDQEGGTFPMLVRYVTATLWPTRREEIW
jgi:hypothetical protein